MKLFIGLGNPGQKYARNRHNVGAMALDRIAQVAGLGVWRSRFHSLAVEGEFDGERVLLIKPQTYYNETGNAVREAAKFLKIKVSDIIVFHDEIDLAPGKLRVKTGGGLAGNNGLRSMQAQLSSPDFVRVRIGVGHPGDKTKVASYVLRDFPKADFDWLSTMLDAIAGSTGRLANGDIERFQTDIAQAMSNLKTNNGGKTAPDAGRAAPKDKATARPRTAAGSAISQGGTHQTGKTSSRTRRNGNAPSQLQLAKAAASAPRKTSRKIKKGIQGPGQTPVAGKSRNESGAAADNKTATDANPLAERLKRWFSGETNET